MVKTQISSKGQTTIPEAIRSRWKVSMVFWEVAPDGSAIVRPVPDAKSLLGIAKTKLPKDPNELEKAHRAIVKDVTRKGVSR